MKHRTKLQFDLRYCGYRRPLCGLTLNINLVQDRPVDVSIMLLDFSGDIWLE